jgi:hypothetical protein
MYVLVGVDTDNHVADLAAVIVPVIVECHLWSLDQVAGWSVESTAQ